MISKLRLSLLIINRFYVSEDQVSVIGGNILSDGCLMTQKIRGTSGIKVIHSGFTFS